MDPKKPKLFEITPDKKMDGEFYYPQARALEVHVLATIGTPEGALRRIERQDSLWASTYPKLSWKIELDD